MIFRRFSNARSWSCFTAPSERSSAAATSRMLFSSHETHVDHFPLQVRQLLDLLIQGNPSIDVLECARIRHVGRRLVRVASPLAPVVHQGVRGDPEQPGRQWCAAPLEAMDRAQRLLENLRCDVFSGRAVLRAATDEGIDSVDVSLANLDKSGRIGLCRLDQKPVVFDGMRQSEPRVSIVITAAGAGKLWLARSAS